MWVSSASVASLLVAVSIFLAFVRVRILPSLPLLGEALLLLTVASKETLPAADV